MKGGIDVWSLWKNASPNEYPTDECVPFVEKNTTKQAKKDSKVERSKLELHHFLNMDHDTVNNATLFKHFYGEDESQYIERKRLKDG